MNFPELPEPPRYGDKYSWAVKVRADDVVVSLRWTDTVENPWVVVAREVVVVHRMGTDGEMIAAIKAANSILGRMRMAEQLSTKWPQVKVDFE